MATEQKSTSKKVRLSAEYNCDCGRNKVIRKMVKYSEIESAELPQQLLLPTGWSFDEDGASCVRCTNKWLKANGFVVS